MLAIKARAIRVEWVPYDGGTAAESRDPGGAGAEEERLEPFNAEESGRRIPFPAGAYGELYGEMPAGQWGFRNRRGETVVPPRYTVTVGFFDSTEHKGERFALTGTEDGKGKIRMGAVNGRGEEILPCAYAEVHYCRGDSFAFREPGGKLYGVADRKGKTVSGPAFRYADGYDETRRLLCTGADRDHLGVRSLDRDRMITPEAYASFAFRKNHIRCEYPWNEADDYDYEGNLLARGFLKDCDTDSFTAALQTGSLQFFRPDGTEIPRTEISNIRLARRGPDPEDCAPAFDFSGGTAYGRVYDPETTRKSRSSYEAKEAFFSALHERQVPPSWLTEEFFPKLLACGSGEEKDAERRRAAEEIRKRFPPKGREPDGHESWE